MGAEYGINMYSIRDPEGISIALTMYLLIHRTQHCLNDHLTDFLSKESVVRITNGCFGGEWP